MDMNRVVGTHDILMLCFDTLRYDVSKAEEAAGGTPVLNSHGGLDVYKRQSVYRMHTTRR